jgi:electron transfer flavoprotein beta subunit
MHIVVLAKQVLDPDGVNSYALWGRLAVDESGRSFATGGAVPQIINAYDEQAMEAALRIRDAGVECTITAISAGGATVPDVLKRCVALGANAAVHVEDTAGGADGFRTAALLAAAIRNLDPVDLILCGRQGSDYDQGTVPGVLAELLDAALVTMAGDVQAGDGVVRVTRATSIGPELVEATLPAVVSVSNEIGIARYPSSRGMLAARRHAPKVERADDLLAGAGGSGVEVVELSVPDVQGHCQIIAGSDGAAKARALVQELEKTGVLR